MQAQGHVGQHHGKLPALQDAWSDSVSKAKGNIMLSHISLELIQIRRVFALLIALHFNSSGFPFTRLRAAFISKIMVGCHIRRLMAEYKFYINRLKRN